MTNKLKEQNPFKKFEYGLFLDVLEEYSENGTLHTKEIKNQLMNLFLSKDEAEHSIEGFKQDYKKFGFWQESLNLDYDLIKNPSITIVNLGFQLSENKTLENNIKKMYIRKLNDIDYTSLYELSEWIKKHRNIK